MAGGEFNAMDSFLGTGWSFPPEFVVQEAGDGPSRPAGQVRVTADEADIEASLRILFGTAMGERFLQPTYGLDMGELLFDSISTTMKTYLEDRIKTTTLVFEPRIDLLAVRINTTKQTEGWLAIEVEYAVRSTNTRYNLVYPFALNDGNEVRALLGTGA